MPHAFSGILDIDKTANSFGLDDNCFYCSVAALLGKTVNELIDETEIMQDRTACTEAVLDLFREAGVDDIAFRIYEDRQSLEGDFANFPRNSGLGLAYDRSDAPIGHMVVLARDNDGVVKLVDYQQSPPSITDFPPEGRNNIARCYVFYRQ